MKIALIFSSIIITGLVLAQTSNFTPGLRVAVSPPPYDRRIPLPLSLDAAHAKALLKLGTATNQFQCISATCLPRLHTHGIGPERLVNFGWTFEFSDTNGAPMKVDVYFDKSATTLIERTNYFQF